MKQSGLGDALLVAGVDLSGDIQSLQTIGGGPAALDVTPISKSAFARIGGLRDGRFEFTSFWNPGPEADAAHAVLSTMPTSDVQLVYCRGLGLGSPAAAITAKQTSYDGSRGTDGSLTLTVAAPAAQRGIEWGVQATPGIREDEEATDGDPLDLGASSAYGLQAYLQLLDFDGTSVTVTLQHSSDDDDTDPYTDITGGAFAAATGPGTQRIQTARDAAIERYLRVVTTGTFDLARFLVVVVVNQVPVMI